MFNIVEDMLTHKKNTKIVIIYFTIPFLNVFLHPELRPHFSLASESDAADQEDVDDDFGGSGQQVRRRGSSSAPPLAPPPAAAAAANDDTVATSGVSTLSSTMSNGSPGACRSVSVELGRMKLETTR